jgi:hypothetical protein
MVNPKPRISTRERQLRMIVIALPLVTGLFLAIVFPTQHDSWIFPALVSAIAFSILAFAWLVLRQLARERGDQVLLLARRIFRL